MTNVDNGAYEVLNGIQTCSYCTNRGHYIEKINPSNLTILCNYHYALKEKYDNSTESSDNRGLT